MSSLRLVLGGYLVLLSAVLVLAETDNVSDKALTAYTGAGAEFVNLEAKENNLELLTAFAAFAEADKICHPRTDDGASSEESSDADDASTQDTKAWKEDIAKQIDVPRVTGDNADVDEGDSDQGAAERTKREAILLRKKRGWGVRIRVRKIIRKVVDVAKSVIKAKAVAVVIGAVGRKKRALQLIRRKRGFWSDVWKDVKDAGKKILVNRAVDYLTEWTGRKKRSVSQQEMAKLANECQGWAEAFAELEDARVARKWSAGKDTRYAVTSVQYDKSKTGTSPGTYTGALVDVYLYGNEYRFILQNAMNIGNAVEMGEAIANGAVAEARGASAGNDDDDDDE